MYQVSLLTVFYMYYFPYYRKTAFKAKYSRLHLNLSIALLLALITFVSGIETAKDSDVSIILYVWISNLD